MLQKIYEKTPLSLIIFFTLLPFGNFFFRKMDLWHGMGMYVQVGVVIIFSLSILKYNKPLGILTLWLGLLTSFLWYEIMSKSGQYPVKIFFPFFNYLTIVLLYKLLVGYLNIENLERLIKYLSYSLLIILFYCVLQFLNLDPYFEHFNEGAEHYKDQLVGTIGNPSHLGGFLAIITPFFIDNKLALILIGILILLCSSASGIIVAIAVVLFYLFHTHRKLFYIGLSGSVLSLIIGVVSFGKFFTSSGRLEVWVKLFEVFKKSPIIGQGLGVFGTLNIQQTSNVSTWRHLHLEYYQLAIEVGLIGLLLAIWCIYDYFCSFSKHKTILTIKLASVFFGFCILCLFSFPAHLWLMSSIGLLAYSSIYIVKKESLKCELAQK